MRSTAVLSVLGIIILASSLVACGGKSSNEDALAGSLLLQTEDFPAGWTQVTPPESPADVGAETDDPYQDCPKIQVQGLRGQAESPKYTDPDSIVLVDQTLRLFDSPQNASDVITRDAFLDAMACRVQAMNDGKIDDESAKFSGASLEKVTARPVGEATAAYRLRVIVTFSGDKPLQMPLYIDTVMVSQGRTWYVLDAASPFLPADFWLMTTEELGDQSSFMAWLATRALDKITGANLAAASPGFSLSSQTSAATLSQARAVDTNLAIVAAMREVERLVQSALGSSHH